MSLGATSVISAAATALRSAIAAPVAGLIKSARATSSSAPITAPTPKLACKPLSELLAERAALHPNDPRRGKLNSAIYSARHDILRRGR